MSRKRILILAGIVLLVAGGAAAFVLTRPEEPTYLDEPWLASARATWDRQEASIRQLDLAELTEGLADNETGLMCARELERRGADVMSHFANRLKEPTTNAATRRLLTETLGDYRYQREEKLPLSLQRILLAASDADVEWMLASDVFHGCHWLDLDPDVVAERCAKTTGRLALSAGAHALLHGRFPRVEQRDALLAVAARVVSGTGPSEPRRRQAQAIWYSEEMQATLRKAGIAHRGLEAPEDPSEVWARGLANTHAIRARATQDFVYGSRHLVGHAYQPAPDGSGPERVLVGLRLGTTLGTDRYESPELAVAVLQALHDELAPHLARLASSGTLRAYDGDLPRVPLPPGANLTWFLGIWGERTHRWHEQELVFFPGFTPDRVLRLEAVRGWTIGPLRIEVVRRP